MEYNYSNGIDGRVAVGVLETDGCCPPDICEISPESISCSLVSLLPSGPLWDKSKELALACNTRCEDNCDTEQSMCASLVLHAIYSGRKLYSNIMGALWPALREASPYTAYSTMDEWLDRLGWADCYNTFCRDKRLGEITPYEIMGECGVEFCPPTFGADLSLIYKRGVIVALWRMRHGFVHNLAGINFILSSLYSEVLPDPDYDPRLGGLPSLILRPTADFANVVLKEPCPRTDATILQGQKQVKLYLTPGNGLCVGGPRRAYPLTLAAHCILMSILPTCCIIRLSRQP